MDRTVITHPKGRNLEELEKEAFRLAREYFGDKPSLEVSFSYTAQKDAITQRFSATVYIRESLDHRPRQEGRRRSRHCCACAGQS